jgi:DNA-binding beta-propeller fold protein YncE
MTRSHAPALGFVFLSAVVAAAFPFPTPSEPLPDGAIRRFGRPDPPAPKPARPDAKSRQMYRASRGPTGAALAVTPDGRSLVVADATGRIDVFDLANGRLQRRLQEPNPEGIHVIAVSSDGRWLACGRVRGDLQLWDLPAGKAVAVFPIGPQIDADGRGLVERIAFGPDSKVLFTGVEMFSTIGNRGATAWEVPSGKRLWNVTDVGYNLAADPRGRWVLTGLIQEEPPRLGLFDAATGKLARGLLIEPSWDMEDGIGVMLDASATLDRLFTPDGSRLVTIHGDGTVRVWDPEAGRETARMRLGRNRSAEPGGLACSPDGRWVAVRHDLSVQIWELASARKAYTIAGLDGSPRNLAFTRDGRGVLTSTGAAPFLWSLKPKDLPRTDGPADALWEGLGSEDTAAAYRLVWALSENPKAAVAIFRDRVRPKELALVRERFDRLVAGLDSAEYAARERAERALTTAGFTVPGGWLRQALAEARSEEVRARLERVLSARETPSPARWRLERAVQLLEMAGTAEATKLLQEWAAGPAGGFLTEVASGAAARAARR